MAGMDLILKYFPQLTERQREQLAALGPLYADWNAKINVISRKDIDNLYEHHVLHSLGIAQAVNFRPGTRVMDVGTGGGFPGIPLAILFPETSFLLVDSVGKKLKVADDVARNIGLTNVETAHERVEDEKRKFHFVVCRAVMPLPDIVRMVRKNIMREQLNALPNGIICLKGGDLQAELAPILRIATVWELSDGFEEEYFQTKKVIHVML